MFEHDCLDTCCFGCLMCMCLVFLCLHLFSAIEHVSHGKALWKYTHYYYYYYYYYYCYYYYYLCNREEDDILTETEPGVWRLPQAIGMIQSQLRQKQQLRVLLPSTALRQPPGYVLFEGICIYRRCWCQCACAHVSVCACLFVIKPRILF